MRSIVPILLLLIFSACTSEPLEFADWTIPVPEGTPIIEYAAVPMEERTERIELVEDLVVGEEPGDTSPPFYKAMRAAVAPDGRIYVLDMGERSIKSFGPDGQTLRVFGHEGQGPAELSRIARNLTVAGDKIIVSDEGNARLSVWTLEGEHLADLGAEVGRVGPFAGFDDLTGFEDGSFAAIYTDRSSSDGVPHRHVVHVSDEGQVVRQYADLSSQYVYAQVGGRRRMVPVPTGSPQFSASPGGSLYLTSAAEYQILAFKAPGTPRWALRVRWRRDQLSREARNRALEAIRSMSRAMGSEVSVRSSDVDWPDSLPALRAIRVDGHGHLYVFPFVDGPIPPEPGEDRPVDVYSPAGEHLFSGWIDGRFAMIIDWPSWTTSQGDYIYGIEEDSTTRDQKLVRYRLVEPF